MANSQELLKLLLSSDALKGISSASGVSGDSVGKILEAALPALMNGANKQSTNETTSASFAEALMNHATKDTSNLSSFFKNVDLTDGGKIVKHLLGSADKTSEDVAKKTGASSNNVTKVLAASAPLLMSLIGKQVKATKGANTKDILGAATSLLSTGDVKNVAAKVLKESAKNVKVDLSDGVDLQDVVGIIGKMIK